MSGVAARERRTRGAGRPEPVLSTRLYSLREEKGFPVALLVEATAREAPIHRWRIVSDERRWLMPGPVLLELTGTTAQLRAFCERWPQTVFLHGWQRY